MADALLYWEDFQPGNTLEIGSHTFTEEEIIAFARQFDPQSFHIDPASAWCIRAGKRSTSAARP
jgi:acyl dehydratase